MRPVLKEFMNFIKLFMHKFINYKFQLKEKKERKEKKHSVGRFATGLRGAQLLETRIDFACTDESWERAVESWTSDMEI